MFYLTYFVNFMPNISKIALFTNNAKNSPNPKKENIEIIKIKYISKILLNEYLSVTSKDKSI